MVKKVLTPVILSALRRADRLAVALETVPGATERPERFGANFGRRRVEEDILHPLRERPRALLARFATRWVYVTLQVHKVVPIPPDALAAIRLCPSNPPMPWQICTTSAP